MKLNWWIKGLWGIVSGRRQYWVRKLAKEPMCVIMVDGGFCSVLMKLAIGLAIEKKSGAKVKYDLSWFRSKGVGCDGKSHRGFTLTEVFPHVDFKIASDEEVYWFKKISYSKNRFPFIYDENYLCLNGYLDGYYANWKYLYFVRDELIRLLRFDLLNLDDANAQMRDQINRSPQSVAVHVRRGDFVCSGNAVLSAEYYLSVLDFLTAERGLSDAEFFFFSDDTKWVEDHIISRIPGNKSKCVDINDQSKGYLDLYLISICRHQVSSNSSFGFFGGVLNQCEDKEVVIPDVWYPPNKSDPLFRGHSKAFRVPGWTVFSVEKLEPVEDV